MWSNTPSLVNCYLSSSPYLNIIAMSMPKVQYYFRPGRLMQRGRTNPGILIVDRIRSFQCNGISKDKSKFNYVCNERLTVGVKCRAKAVVIKMTVEGKGVKPVLVKVDLEHDCPANMPKAISDEMKAEMKLVVRAEPQKVLTEAITSMRKKYAEEFDHDDDLFEQIVAELGPDKPMLRQLLRVRVEIIGKTPTNRNQFDPSYFLRRLYGKNNKIVIMDSNKLKDGWRCAISKANPESKFHWERMNDDIRAYEEETDLADDEVNTEEIPADTQEFDEGHFDEENDEMDKPEYHDITGKDLPKRVLAYSSERLLKLFSKNLKSSMDGTFKSACTHYGQSFIWMLKFCGHWIPVIHAWLPDKTEQSYKVKIG